MFEKLSKRASGTNANRIMRAILQLLQVHVSAHRYNGTRIRLETKRHARPGPTYSAEQ